MIPLRPATWALFGVVAVVSLIMWPTLGQFAANWAPESENVLGHGWLLLAVIAWGLVSASQRIDFDGSRGVHRGSLWPWLLMVVLGVAWAVFHNASIAVGQQLIWLLAIGAAIWAVMGAQALKGLLWPLALLGLLLPFWSVFHGVLWRLSTLAVGALVQLFGIAVFMNGNTVELSSGRLEIASGCAGLAFFAVANSVAALIGYFNRANWRQHVVLFAAASLVAMFANWIRITIIVWRADATAMQTSLVTEDHYTFGWIVFAIGLLAYCWLFAAYGHRAPGAQAVVPNPNKDAPGAANSSESFRPLRVLAAGACIAVGPLLSLAAERRTVDHVPPPEDRFADATMLGLDEVGWSPAMPQPDTESLIEIDRDGRSLRLYEAVYHAQEQGREMIGEGSSLWPLTGWQLEQQAVEGDAQTVVLRDSIGQRWVVRYGYSIGQWHSSNPLAVQLRFGVSKLIANPAARVTALATMCESGCADERALLARHWSALR